MMFNLVCAFILVLFVSTSTGVNWIGNFAANTTCNTAVCCCPEPTLNVTNTSGGIAIASKAQGMCKTTSATVKIDPVKNAANVADYGDFTLAKDDNAIEVTLKSNNSNITSACKITMYRDVTSMPGNGSGTTPVPTPPTAPSNGSGTTPVPTPPSAPGNGSGTTPSPTRPGAATTTAKNNNAPATGDPNPNNGKPQCNPTSGSDVASNYSSIWFTFLSVIIVTLFFEWI